jgi:hypothetical protein
VHIADYEFSQNNPAMAVGADLSRPPPIYRPRGDPQHIPVHFLKLIIGPGSHPRI